VLDDENGRSVGGRAGGCHRSRVAGAGPQAPRTPGSMSR
jgi:hypothetical protein